jgi:L-threonylcarbamoyladenylate synthase
VAPADLAREAMRHDVRAAVLAHTRDAPATFSGTWRCAPSDPVAYAHELYANLRTLDSAGATLILIESVPADDAWLAVADRLARAVYAEDDDRD